MRKVKCICGPKAGQIVESSRQFFQAEVPPKIPKVTDINNVSNDLAIQTVTYRVHTFKTGKHQALHFAAPEGMKPLDILEELWMGYRLSATFKERK